MPPDSTPHIQPITLHPRPHNNHPQHRQINNNNNNNPLPPLLQTPSGLALLELQGTINLPSTAPALPAATAGPEERASSSSIPIGRLHFPDYHPDAGEASDAWTKRVWLYVGGHQRLLGEVKKLPRPVGVLRRRRGRMRGDEGGGGLGDAAAGGEGDDGEGEELEVVEVVKYKVVFSQRPEPVGGVGGGGGGGGGM